MKAVLRAALLATVALTSGCGQRRSPPSHAPPRHVVKQHFAEQGLAVDFSIHPAQADIPALRAKDSLSLRFELHDTAGAVLAGARPAAWIDARKPGSHTDARSCTRKVAAFLSGNILTAPAVDLNAFDVLTLNEDATIAVVDPRFGYGGSQLLSLVTLPAPGDDWALPADQRRLFVSVPDANEISVVDTSTWQSVAHVPVGPRPSRLLLQGDGKYLWALFGDGEVAGVAAVDTESLRVAARFELGSGRHELALDEERHLALITNHDAGTLSVIDWLRLSRMNDVPTGGHPLAITQASASRLAYVLLEEGEVIAVSGEQRRVTARIASEPGASDIRVAPGGRFVFLPNPVRNIVSVIDAARNRVSLVVPVDAQPERVAFSDTLAYVQSRSSELVRMIPLSQAAGAGSNGTVPQPAEFSGGQAPLGRALNGERIVSAPGDTAMLVANAADRTIYYYKEGMAAAMGSFSNYSREPRAVRVIDRSLRARGPGEYETVTRVKEPGEYDVVLLVDSPRLVHCFPIRVEASEPRSEVAQTAKVIPRFERSTVEVGRDRPVAFQLLGSKEGRPLTGLHDVTVLALRAPGVWQRRFPAVASGDGYQADVQLPEPGAYYVFVESRAAGLRLNNSQFFTLQAAAKGADVAPASERL